MTVSDIVFKKYNPFTEHEKIREIWTSLLARCPHAYYLSWAWIGNGIKCLPHDSDLHLIVGFRNERPVIAFFVGSRTTIRHKFFKIRKLSINETGDPYFDLTWIEYNAVLIDPEITILLGYLLKLTPMKWDEFIMTRCAPIYQPNLQLDDPESKDYNLSIVDMRSYYVNLDKVRRNNDDYLALISSKKRYQIRRSIKEYEKMGQILLSVAENTEDAINIFNELSQLHQKAWTERGFPGSFSNEYFDRFHKKLITERFEYGEIQLMKVTAGDHVLGCLYGFIYRGQFLGTLSGFNYLPGHLYSPGLICHYLAIIHYARMGLNCYDFLEGDDDYKRSLSTDYNIMQNIRVQKVNIKHKAEKMLLQLHELYKTCGMKFGRSGDNDERD